MDATTFFLTYPRADIDSNALIAFLESIKPVVWARVGRELHADEGRHSHCIVRFGARVKTRNNIRIFDYEGHHPNIQVPRKLLETIRYCGKDGDFVDQGPVPTPKGETDVDDIIALAKGGDRDAFDRACLAARLSYQWASHLWGRHAVDQSTVREAGEGVECQQLRDLQFNGQVMVVVGASGCGKSSWAKRVAPKPALWVTHLDDLKKLSREHKSIIFDDMSFHHLPRTTQIYLADWNDSRTIHCRNTNATIPAMTPKIFTANEHPFDREDPAIARRLHTVNLISFNLTL